MKRLLSIAAAMVAAAPVLAQTVEVETARGPIELAQMPGTIVVLDVAAVDTLDALGVMPDGITDRLYVSYLDDVAAGAEVTGTLFEPDFEAINAMQPDLIVVGGRSSEQVEPLSAIAPAIDMTILGDDHVAEVLARLDAYGSIFGKEAEAEALAQEFETKLDAANEAVAGKGTGLIVMTNGPKVSAYGAGSRFGWLHQALGLPEAVEGVDEATHGEAISFEFIRDANPDWLIVVDRAAAIGEEGARAEQTLDNALVAETTAWSEGQVVHLDSAEIYIAGGGIQSMMRALDRVTESFRNAPDA
jgi:iron complex transport system substrate-binding protein